MRKEQWQHHFEAYAAAGWGKKDAESQARRDAIDEIDQGLQTQGDARMLGAVELTPELERLLVVVERGGEALLVERCGGFARKALTFANVGVEGVGGLALG